jgi:murein L,D-transpeptidase YafK
MCIEKKCSPAPLKRALASTGLASLLGILLLLHSGIPSARAEGKSAGEASAAVQKRPTIIVHKAKRHLLYFENDVLKRDYPIVLGKKPTGHKLRRGDYRTPEGEYYITHKSTASRFYRFMGLSYPNIEDARRGLTRKLIDQAQFLIIKTAIKSRQRPPSGTRLGGLIGIHGEGKYRGFTSRHRINWTEGCISVSDEDMKILYDKVEVGTPVVILP